MKDTYYKGKSTAESSPSKKYPALAAASKKKKAKKGKGY